MSRQPPRFTLVVQPDANGTLSNPTKISGFFWEMENAPCIKRALAHFSKVSAQYRFHCISILRQTQTWSERKRLLSACFVGKGTDTEKRDAHREKGRIQKIRKQDTSARRPSQNLHTNTHFIQKSYTLIFAKLN